MAVAIVGGTAGLGFGLAVRLASIGEDVLIGSRQSEKAMIAVDEARSKIADGSLQGGRNEDVVADADIVFVTVPFPGQAATYSTIKPVLSEGALIVHCTVPLASEVGGKATRMLGIWEGSAAQQAKGILGAGVKLASGFHTVMADVLSDLSKPIDQDILVCGDPDAREAASSIIAKIDGARYVDCGPLENAR
ncbi:MAG: NADPH-dependent F420 reductase, partial [Actinobacteria bacterium]|nr:NADPH-dependent F420 reductase [Actinomycetota bacterium]